MTFRWLENGLSLPERLRCMSELHESFKKADQAEEVAFPAETAPPEIPKGAPSNKRLAIVSILFFFGLVLGAARLFWMKHTSQELASQKSEITQETASRIQQAPDQMILVLKDAAQKQKEISTYINLGYAYRV